MEIVSKAKRGDKIKIFCNKIRPLDVKQEFDVQKPMRKEN